MSARRILAIPELSVAFICMGCLLAKDLPEEFHRADWFYLYSVKEDRLFRATIVEESCFFGLRIRRVKLLGEVDDPELKRLIREGRIPVYAVTVEFVKGS